MELYQKLDLQYIAGKWCIGQSEKYISDHDPYSQKQIVHFKAANTEDVDAAYDAAQHTFQSGILKNVNSRRIWIQQLIQVIHKRREEIITWLIQESGSTRIKANIEVDAALGIVTESLSFLERSVFEALVSPDKTRNSYVVRKPLGVIAVISPWNFPFHLSMRSVITSIACGNTVVLKPASDTPIVGGTLLGKLFEEANFPAGVLNVIVGSGSEIGDYFVEHAIPKIISFTGSTEVGQRVGVKAIASTHLKRLALELGGNAALVILDDADLDLAVELTIMGRFLHQGQICMSTNRVIVDSSIHDIFVEKLLLRIKQIKVGNPSEQDTLIGPIINAAQVQKIREMIAKAIEQGSCLIYSNGIEGNLVTPHIFTEVDPKSTLALEESFGPILPIIKANHEQHALEIANSTRYGLSSAICTSNIQRGQNFAEQLDVGMTHINGISVADHPNAPFGGERNSGIGRFNGPWIFEEFTRTHWITIPNSV